jgi:hypothetical protein
VARRQVGDDDTDPALRFVAEVHEDVDADRTRVVLQGSAPAPEAPRRHKTLEEVIALVEHGRPKRVAPVEAPAGDEGSDTALRLAQVIRPELADVLYRAWENATMSDPGRIRVHALRVKAALFGHNAPKIPQYRDGRLEDMTTWPDFPTKEVATRLDLDNFYPDVASGTLVVVESSGRTSRRQFLGIRGRTTVEQIARSDYGIAAKTTRIRFDDGDHWKPPRGETLTQLRSMTVYTQSELLELAPEPITADVCGATLELATPSTKGSSRAGR